MNSRKGEAERSFLNNRRYWGRIHSFRLPKIGNEMRIIGKVRPELKRKERIHPFQNNSSLVAGWVIFFASFELEAQVSYFNAPLTSSKRKRVVLVPANTSSKRNSFLHRFSQIPQSQCSVAQSKKPQRSQRAKRQFKFSLFL